MIHLFNGQPMYPRVSEYRRAYFATWQAAEAFVVAIRPKYVIVTFQLRSGWLVEHSLRQG